MNEQERARLNKQSFELSFRGGSIWCEHLDGMGAMEAEVIHKLRADARSFARPSVSARMIVNLDETVVTDAIAACVADCITGCGKRFCWPGQEGAEANRSAAARLRRADRVSARLRAREGMGHELNDDGLPKNGGPLFAV